MFFTSVPLTLLCDQAAIIDIQLFSSCVGGIIEDGTEESWGFRGAKPRSATVWRLLAICIFIISELG